MVLKGNQLSWKRHSCKETSHESLSVSEISYRRARCKTIDCLLFFVCCCLGKMDATDRGDTRCLRGFFDEVDRISNLATGMGPSPSNETFTSEALKAPASLAGLPPNPRINSLAASPRCPKLKSLFFSDTSKEYDRHRRTHAGEICRLEVWRIFVTENVAGKQGGKLRKFGVHAGSFREESYVDAHEG